MGTWMALVYKKILNIGQGKEKHVQANCSYSTISYYMFQVILMSFGPMTKPHLSCSSKTHTLLDVSLHQLLAAAWSVHCLSPGLARAGCTQKKWLHMTKSQVTVWLHTINHLNHPFKIPRLLFGLPSSSQSAAQKGVSVTLACNSLAQKWNASFCLVHWYWLRPHQLSWRCLSISISYHCFVNIGFLAFNASSWASSNCSRLLCLRLQEPMKAIFDGPGIAHITIERKNP